MIADGRVHPAEEPGGLLNIDLDRPLLDAAGVLQTVPPLRTLDAIHLASARTVPELRSIVTYDRWMAAAAESLGPAVESPA